MVNIPIEQAKIVDFCRRWEAARRVSDTFKAAHPEIPWHGISGQRNVLTHEYGEILLDRVWLVATERLPELIRLLDPLIPPPPGSDE